MESRKEIAKKRLFFGIAGSFLFILLGIWLVWKAEDQAAFEPIVLQITGWLSVAFFGIMMIIGIAGLLKGKK